MVNKSSTTWAFFACGVGNALVKTNGDGNGKSPPHFRRRGLWERRMALAAAVSRLSAENNGGESGLHDDAIVFIVCVSRLIFLSRASHFSFSVN